MTFSECMAIRHYTVEARKRLEELEDAEIIEHDTNAWQRFANTWYAVEEFMDEHNIK